MSNLAQIWLIHINMNLIYKRLYLIYDLTLFTPSKALRAYTVARAAADPGILIFFQPGWAGHTTYKEGHIINMDLVNIFFYNAFLNIFFIKK